MPSPDIESIRAECVPQQPSNLQSQQPLLQTVQVLAMSVSITSLQSGMCLALVLDCFPQRTT